MLQDLSFYQLKMLHKHNELYSATAHMHHHYTHDNNSIKLEYISLGNCPALEPYTKKGRIQAL